MFSLQISLNDKNAADVLSLFPGLQQCVGLGTIASNLLKIAFDKFQEICLNAFTPERDKNSLAFAERFEAIQENKKTHAFYVGIGALRMIPGVGTITSLARLIFFSVKS